MKKANVKFNRYDAPDFVKVLNQRVTAYFKDNSIKRQGDYRMIVKTIFMLTAYLTPFVLLFTPLADTWYTALACWLAMGLGMAGVGLAVMHDGNHGTYSPNSTLNKIMGFTSNILGAYHKNWKIQHNVLHHSFTNVHEYDDDLKSAGMFKMSPYQEGKKFHKFQALYAPFFYSLLTLNWYATKDYFQAIRYNDEGLLSREGLTLKTAIRNIIINKTWYGFIILGLPMIFGAYTWWFPIVGFVLMQMLCGLILSLIFQCAHVIEETEFFIPSEDDNSVENNWAIHQLRSTANFATYNRVLSWLIGGLNYQVEHHLFPQICHIHYRKIAPIVQQTAKEYGIPYNSHKTFIGALISHFKHLHRVGNTTFQPQAVRSMAS